MKMKVNVTPRPTRLFLQPWWIQMLTNASVAFPICIALSVIIYRGSGSGWLRLFEQLWPFVIVQPILFFSFRNYFNERFYARKLPLRRSQGLSLKVVAVVLSILAMLTGILASENPAASVWAPGGELWLVILMIILLWTLAVLSFLTGDAVVQYAALTKEKKAGSAPAQVDADRQA